VGALSSLAIRQDKTINRLEQSFEQTGDSWYKNVKLIMLEQ